MPMTLPDGRLGGGFDAPAVAAPTPVEHDDTAAFRARVSSCSALPAGIAPDDKIVVVLRVSFKSDGTLSSSPQVLDATASPKGQALTQSAIEALQRCQPYTMLPVKKYKTLDLGFSPMNFSGR
jgi:hypothetical protein